MTTGAAVALIAVVLMVPAAAQAVQTNVIDVTAQPVSSNIVRFPPTGRGGDAEFARWLVRDRFGRSIGDMLLDCRWVVNDLRLCIGQLTLPRGSLAILGASRTRFLGQLSVVGGGGLYVDAQGTLTFKAVGTNRYVLQITYRKARSQ